MKNSIILCSCNHIEHQLTLIKDRDNNSIYLRYFLSNYSFWERVKISIKYIFGHKSKHGHFGEFIIDQENYSQFKQIINFFENHAQN